MQRDKNSRLSALEARLPAKPAVADAILRERLQLMTYLAARRPHESACEAITRMLDVSPGAIRTADFADRWDEFMRPLRNLEGPAFAAACEAIRERHL